MNLIIALFIVTAPHGGTAGCGGLYGNAAIWVREADVIVRARAVEETPLPARVLGMSRQVRFEIVETLKGGASTDSLEFPGRLTEVDDGNDSAGSAKWVRHGGRAGSCFAESYRRGAEFLLMLRRGQDGGLTPYWASLGATNEQLFGPDDEWLAWVRRQVATPDGAKAMFYDPLPTPHVWTVESDSGAELTPRHGQYAGFLMDDREYVVPGEFDLGSAIPARRLIVIFSRSQTEQAASVADARERLDAIAKWTTPGGFEVVRESEDSLPAEIGTYVVNQRGRPVAAEIVVRSVKRE